MRLPVPVVGKPCPNVELTDTLPLTDQEPVPSVTETPVPRLESEPLA
jgi:hypothetical protein